MSSTHTRTSNLFKYRCGTANQCLKLPQYSKSFWDSLHPEEVYEVALELGFNEKISSILHYGYYGELFDYYNKVKTDTVPKELLFDWYLKKNYGDVHFDVFKFRAVKKVEKNYKELEEEDFDEIHTQFIGQFPWVSYSEYAAYKKVIAYAKKNKIDSYVEHINGMPSSIQALDEILDELISSMQVLEEETEIAKLYLKVWFTGIIHRCYNPGSKFDMILVLNGIQGIGKTLFLEDIFPDSTYIMSNSKELDSKDKLINLSSNAVVIWDEIGSFNSKYLSDAIKQFITLKFDTFRPVWGRKNVTRGRRCVFAATTNDHDILDDLTGDRRFLPITVQYINQKQIESIVPRLLGKLRDLYKDNEVKPYFTRSEQLLQKEHNSKYHKDDSHLEVIRDWIEDDINGEWKQGFTTKEVLNECLHLSPVNFDKKITTHVGKILRSLGYQKKRIRNKETRKVKTAWVLTESPALK